MIGCIFCFTAGPITVGELISGGGGGGGGGLISGTEFTVRYYKILNHRYLV